MSGGAGKAGVFWTAIGSLAAVAALIWGVYTFSVSSKDNSPDGSGFVTTIPGQDGSPGATKQHPLTRFTGTWTGSIVQFNTSQKYPVTLTITIPAAGQIVGISGYPSLSCGGELRLIGVSDTVLRVEELITEGKAPLFGKGCVNSFIVLQLLPDGQLFYKVSDKDGLNAAPLGEGTLTHS